MTTTNEPKTSWDTVADLVKVLAETMDKIDNINCEFHTDACVDWFYDAYPFESLSVEELVTNLYEWHEDIVKKLS